jgi:hypothetical protein
VEFGAAATSSRLHGSFPPKNAADLRNLAGTAYFRAANQANAWLCYDFKKLEVTPTHYAVVSSVYESDHHSKSWCLEVSKEGNNGTEVRQCPENNDLNASNRCIHGQAVGTVPICSSSPNRHEPLEL